MFNIKIKKDCESVRRGFSVLEVILAVALFSIFSTAAVLFSLQSLGATRQGGDFEVALTYASEGLEGVRTISGDSFDRLMDTSGSGLFFAEGKWKFQNDHDESGIYSRKIIIEMADRDGSGDIVSGTGTQDLNMKHITSSVSWLSSSRQPVSIELETYLSNWK